MKKVQRDLHIDHPGKGIPGVTTAVVDDMRAQTQMTVHRFKAQERSGNRQAQKHPFKARFMVPGTPWKLAQKSETWRNAMPLVVTSSFEYYSFTGT